MQGIRPVIVQLYAQQTPPLRVKRRAFAATPCSGRCEKPIMTLILTGERLSPIPATLAEILSLWKILT